MRITAVAVATATTASVVLTGCAGGHDRAVTRPVVHLEPTPPGVHSTVRTRSTEARPVPHLVRFNDCDQLLHTIQQQALAQVTADGLPWNQGPTSMVGAAVPAPMPMGVAGATGAGSAQSGAGESGGAASTASAPGYSGTNDQESGVDEPDVVKTDGKLLVVARDGAQKVDVYDVSGGSPRRVSSLSFLGRIESPELFLVGSSAVVIGQSIGYGMNGEPSSTVAAVVDLADPAHPEVVRTFKVTGEEVDARFVGGRVELVVQSTPALPMEVPAAPVDSEGTLEHNRAVVVHSSLSAWLPTVTSTPSHGTVAPPCTDTWHTVGARDDSLSTISVVSFDPGSESSVHETTVFGSATVVYASTHALYLATPAGSTPRPMPMMGMAGSGAGSVAVPGPMPVVTGAPYASDTTSVHEFDISDPATPRYVGSGVVPGTLVDQYSMGEYDGYLRIATTVGIADPAPGEGLAPRVKSDNRVTILHAVNGVLAPVGRVSGLGRGEKIYGVRFLGALGYVVTFRQIDPLYVLDLADPEHPRALGHLEVTGYSAYLHPLGDGQLFGLGREVDSRAHPIGEQLSVFNVSDPAAPTLLSRVRLANVYSPAENDFHAFLWWPADRLLVVPMQAWDGAPYEAESVYHVDSGGTLKRVGSLQQPGGSNEYLGGTMRSVVIGGLLYTVTDRGVMANDLNTLELVAWLPSR